MTRSELNQAVARATGETIHEVRHRGFVELAELHDNEDELLSCFLDWDDVDLHRNVAMIGQTDRHVLV